MNAVELGGDGVLQDRRFSLAFNLVLYLAIDSLVAFCQGQPFQRVGLYELRLYPDAGAQGKYDGPYLNGS